MNVRLTDIFSKHLVGSGKRRKVLAAGIIQWVGILSTLGGLANLILDFGPWWIVLVGVALFIIGMVSGVTVTEETHFSRDLKPYPGPDKHTPSN